jgi:hypothetical protein
MPPLLLHIWPIITNLLAKAAEVLEKQKKLIMPGIGVLCLLLIGLAVIPLVIRHSSNLGADSARTLNNTDRLTPLSIPQEDFFLPDEPDFLPEVLLEREPRSEWTPDDALPFWKDPLHEDPEKWRGRIEMVIDELLEGVP